MHRTRGRGTPERTARIQGQMNQRQQATAATRQRVLEYLVAYHAEHGYAPNYRQIAEGCGLSTISLVTGHLDALEREGYIKRGEPGASRAIRLLPKAYRGEVTT